MPKSLQLTFSFHHYPQMIGRQLLFFYKSLGPSSSSEPEKVPSNELPEQSAAIKYADQNVLLGSVIGLHLNTQKEAGTNVDQGLELAHSRPWERQGQLTLVSKVAGLRPLLLVCILLSSLLFCLSNAQDLGMSGLLKIPRLPRASQMSER